MQFLKDKKVKTSHRLSFIGKNTVFNKAGYDKEDYANPLSPISESSTPVEANTCRHVH